MVDCRCYYSFLSKYGNAERRGPIEDVERARNPKDALQTAIMFLVFVHFALLSGVLHFTKAS